MDESKKIKIKVIKPEIYSRVVGYFRPVQNWNTGKQQEFKERHVHYVNEHKTTE